MSSPAELHGFRDVCGEVLAHRHTNPDGSLGGWVAESATVARGAFLAAEAVVFDRASLLGSARVDGVSRIFDTAIVEDKANVIASSIGGEARVAGRAIVTRSTLLGSALAEGDAALDGVEFDAGSIDSGEVTKVHTLREAAESRIRKICKDLFATGHLHLGTTEDAVDFAVGAVVNEASVTGWVVVELKGCTRQTAQIRVINVYDSKDAAHEAMHHLRTAAHQRDPAPPHDDDTFKM